MNMTSLGWALIPNDWCPYERGDKDADMHGGKTREDTRKRRLSTRHRETSGTNPADTLVLDF